MKAQANKKSFLLLAAVFASLACLAYPQKSFAADTSVTCTSPLVELATGRNGTKPRVTVVCTGGSSVSGIDYFAYEISANPNVTAAIPELVGSFVQVNGPGTSITILSDLSDTSGAAWGCAASNCRIIDFLYGY
jgi:hypothetical protein